MIRWLKPSDPPGAFPPPDTALREPDGLLAAGGDLSPARLLAAYAAGIFPWYEEGQPILWWSPDPRSVLYPHSLRVSRSLRRTLRRQTFSVSFDTAFPAVIDACARPRRYGSGTWITAQMRAAYVALHRLGWAHSAEAWRDGRLVGGLYGIAIGHVFFGESMFSIESDASKVALAATVTHLTGLGIRLIDCQLPSPHVESLGAVSIPRARFLRELAEHCTADRPPGSWQSTSGSAAALTARPG
jgi:leucyl/phenylalanyl-tRNA---protein transferase